MKTAQFPLGRMVAFISGLSGSITLILLMVWLGGSTQQNYNKIVNAEIEKKGEIFLSVISTSADNIYANLWALTQSPQFKESVAERAPSVILAELVPFYQQYSNRGLDLILVSNEVSTTLAQIPTNFPLNESIVEKIQNASRGDPISIIETGGVNEDFSLVFSVDIFHSTTLKKIGTLKAKAPLAPPAELLVEAAEASKVACHAIVYEGVFFDTLGDQECLEGLMLYRDDAKNSIYTSDTDRQFLYGTKLVNDDIPGDEFSFVIGSETDTLNILRGQLTSFSIAFGLALVAVLSITIFLTRRLFHSDLIRLLDFVKSSPDMTIEKRPSLRVSEFQRVADGFHVARMRLIAKEREKQAANQSISQLSQKLSEVQSDKMKSLGVLTSGVAHDFNNIIAVMISALDQRDNAGGATPDISVIRHSADRASQLVKKLLAFSHQKDLRSSAFLPATEIQDLISIIEPSFGASYQIELNVETNFALEVDRDQFCASMMNLAINARDAMPDGGKIDFTIRLSRPEELQLGKLPPSKQMMSIVISDSGPGIPTHIKDRIFEPFFTTKPVGKGTGLGLSMALGFAKGAGGILQVRQTDESGTSFIFILPCHDFHPKAHAPTAPILCERLDGMRILVVDDEEVLGKMITKYLISVGADVDRAVSVASALELIENSATYNAIVTDLNMPDGLGTKVIDEAISKQKCPSQFLLISGNFSTNSFETFSNGTTLHRIPKPFRLPELVKILGSSKDISNCSLQ